MDDPIPDSSPPSSWHLTYETFAPEQEGRRESLCTLGNGYFATRGATPESDDDGIHYPGTYIAGGYNRLSSNIEEHVLEHEDLVNFPNWLPLTFRIAGGEWFSLRSVDVLSFRQTLSLREGILTRHVRFRDSAGRTTRIRQRRFVHMGSQHLAGLELTLTPEDWQGAVEFRSALDGSVLNRGARGYRRLNERHLVPLEAAVRDDEILSLDVETNQSKFRVVQAARTRYYSPADRLLPEVRSTCTDDTVAQNAVVSVSSEESITVEKIVALFTSRDMAVSEPGLAARLSVADAGRFETLLADHQLVWKHLWERFAIDLETVPERSDINPLLILHLHVFHVLQTVSPNSVDSDIGLPARGWTGEAYQGHVFWDDIFVFPFLSLRMPEIAQTLIKYRHRRMNAARRIARKLGLRGARFPWQSGSSGREETPRYSWDEARGVWNPDYSHLQLHVNSAIVFNVWQYYQVTGSLEFLFNYGAEIVLEVARFWCSVAEDRTDSGRYEIRGVVGPDEYHVAYPDTDRVGIDNNAYTNVTAAWSLCKALELFQILPADHWNQLSERLNITPQEIEAWEEVSRRMYVPFQDGGIISQFEGYDQLQEFPRHADGRIDMQLLREELQRTGGYTNRYKVSKQADVLMLFYLFSSGELQLLFDRLDYRFDEETIPKNINYYTHQSAHGSTLSRVAHAWVLARSQPHRAWGMIECLCRPRDLHPECPRNPVSGWELFEQALASDVFDVQGGTTPEGIHLGAMGGTVDMIQRCYTGLEVRNDVLWLSPRLPDALVRMCFRLHYRNQSLLFELTPCMLTVTATRSRAETIRIGIAGEVLDLHAGETRTFPI